MEKLILNTGLFEDADIIIKVADAPVIDVQTELSEDQWDDVLDQILDADLIVTAYSRITRRSTISPLSRWLSRIYSASSTFLTAYQTPSG